MHEWRGKSVPTLDVKYMAYWQVCFICSKLGCPVVPPSHVAKMKLYRYPLLKQILVVTGWEGEQSKLQGHV